MKKFLIPFLFSIFLHLCLLKLVNVADTPQKPPLKKQKVTIVSLVNVPAREKKQEKKQLELPNVPEREQEEESKKQVVDLPPDHNAKKPKDARFSSETNHETEKETVSRHRQPTENPAHELMPGKSGNESGQNSPIPPQEHRQPTSAESTPPPLPDGIGPRKKPEEIQLFPTPQELAKIGQNIGQGSGGGAPSNDAIHDVPEGEGTFLNTSAFKYASFYNRVKRDISTMWKPLPKLYKEDPMGNKYMYKLRKTVVTIVLDAEGNVLEVLLKNSSDVEFLDNEAISSVWRCKQFPNPPKGLIMGDRVVFDFGFEVSYGRTGTLF